MNKKNTNNTYGLNDHTAGTDPEGELLPSTQSKKRTIIFLSRRPGRTSLRSYPLFSRSLCDLLIQSVGGAEVIQFGQLYTRVHQSDFVQHGIKFFPFPVAQRK